MDGIHPAKFVNPMYRVQRPVLRHGRTFPCRP